MRSAYPFSPLQGPLQRPVCVSFVVSGCRLLLVTLEMPIIFVRDRYLIGLKSRDQHGRLMAFLRTLVETSWRSSRTVEASSPFAHPFLDPDPDPSVP